MRAYVEREKGVAGLSVLLSVIIILFVIGFIVMIFALMGGELEDEARGLTGTGGAVLNESIAAGVDYVGINLAKTAEGYYDVKCSNINCINESGVVTINPTNYTVDNCNVRKTNASDEIFNGTVWNISYDWTAHTNSSVTEIMHTTTLELADVTDWFGIIIVITAMVVLILLTVIIISAMRGSRAMGLAAPRGSEGISTTTA